MDAIAHRGCLAQYPENTRHAFRESARVVDMIEVDVRRCGSGELVICHDPTLDRVTDGTGPVEETPYEALCDLSVLDSGEPIPLLRELFEVVPTTVGLNVELKDDGIARDVLSMAAEYDHDVLVSSFDADELADAREFLDWGPKATADSAPESNRSSAVPLAYLFMASPDDALDVAAELDCEFVHPSVDLTRETDVVSRARQRGFGINVWTIETRDELDAMRKLGVDGVVIDDCTFAREC